MLISKLPLSCDKPLVDKLKLSLMTNNVQRGANMSNSIQKPSLSDLPVEGYVRLPQVLSVIPVSKSAWWAGIKSGKFPKSVKLGHRTTAWRVEDIRDLIAKTGGAQ
jgi:predicted DNA-binding transcriptional regulator AlpA